MFAIVLFDRDISLAQKRKICIYVNSLSQTDLAKIVHIIHKCIKGGRGERREKR
jgi:hypothetical protein